MSSMPPPAASTAALTFSQTCRVCASMSPTPAIVPSARRAVMPEMKTSRPFASITVACEKTPLGWRNLSDRICCFGIAVLPNSPLLYDRAMMAPFQKRFVELAAERSPLCVGIDPSAESLKGWGLTDDINGLRAFCDGLVETCAPLVASVKPQSAFFERHGPAGLEGLRQTGEAATAHGALVIVDAKRGDIGSTAVAYGETFLGPRSPFRGDAMTLSAYLGLGSLAPIFEIARREGA